MDAASHHPKKLDLRRLVPPSAALLLVAVAPAAVGATGFALLVALCR